MSPEATDPAVEKVIATISDQGLADRYPDRAHFIAAGNPDQGQLAPRALFAGDPAVIVYEDGREVVMRPEHVGGLAGLLLIAAAFLIKLAGSLFIPTPNMSLATTSPRSSPGRRTAG